MTALSGTGGTLALAVYVVTFGDLGLCIDRGSLDSRYPRIFIYALTVDHSFEGKLMTWEPGMRCTG